MAWIDSRNQPLVQMLHEINWNMSPEHTRPVATDSSTNSLYSRLVYSVATLKFAWIE
jgi:hypothetical protein